MTTRTLFYYTCLLAGMCLWQTGRAQQSPQRSVEILPEEKDEEHEGEGAIRYWQDLEAKIRHMNRLNGVTATNREAFKVDAWQRLNGGKSLSRTAASSTGNWTQIVQNASSVGMGRIETVAFHPTNSNVFYLGTAGGGLWRTNDNGVSYFPVTDGLPSSGVCAIAIDPGNANNLYILTGSGLGGQSASSAGVYRSTDGGTQWYATGLSQMIGGTNPLYAYDLKMHPTNPAILFCATNRGLYKTTDAGATWELVLRGSQDGDADRDHIFDIEFKPDNPSVVYAAYWDRIYVSRTNGNLATWLTSTTIYSGYPAGETVDIFASRIAVTPGAPNSIHIASAIDASDNYESTNGAVFYIKATYSSTATSDAITYGTPRKISACSGKTCLRSGQGRIYGDIYVSQLNEGDIIVGGLEFFSSANGGTSWQIKSINCTSGARNFHVDVGSKITVYQGYTYVATDGGLYRQAENYNSSSTSWEDITGGIEITQLYTLGGSPQDAAYYLYANQDNDVHLRTSASTYSSVLGGDGTATKFDQTNKNNYYYCIQLGEFLIRNLAGTTTEITPGSGASNGDEKEYSGYFVFARCFSIDENDNKTLYAFKRSFYKSTNQGTSWTRSDMPGILQPNMIGRVAKSNTNYVYAVESDWWQGNTYIPQVFRTSTNGGTSWVNMTASLPANIIISDLAIDPTNASIIYITSYGNANDRKFYRSINAGSTWENLSDGLPNVDARCIALVNDSRKGIYVGTDLGVYYRDNNTGKWIRFSNGLPIVQVMDLYINPTQQTLSAATFGRGIFVTPMYDPSACPATLTLNSIYFNNTVFVASSSIHSAGMIYPGAETFVTFSSANVVLNPGFSAPYGSGFRATAEGCTPAPIPYRTIRDSDTDTQQNQAPVILPMNRVERPQRAAEKTEGLPKSKKLGRTL